MSIEISPKSFFEQPSVADMRLISCPGAEELTGLIDKHLVRWAKAAGIDKETFIIPCDCPRFQSGDAKGLVKESVRGDDIFIVVDPGNYSVTYKLFNYENHMSPDDHFANLKRLIQAVAGKAHRVSVIMPSLYGGRQHRRVVRESLDCAVALQELQTMGVRNIITFDAHDPRVQNAVPLMSFDNAMPTYQVLKSLLKKDPDLSFDKSNDGETPEGIGFAIPFQLATKIMDKLIRDGRVIRGYIGISGREIAPLHAQGGGIDQIQGIVVNDVAPDGPAAQAGIRANDVIISVNDKPAVSALETMDQVAEIRPGSEIPVVIMRDDKKITLHIAVQEYPATN